MKQSNLKDNHREELIKQVCEQYGCDVETATLYVDAEISLSLS